MEESDGTSDHTHRVLDFCDIATAAQRPIRRLTSRETTKPQGLMGRIVVRFVPKQAAMVQIGELVTF